MNNVLRKSLVLLLSSFLVCTAHAAFISGNITFSGGVALNGDKTAATQVDVWLNTSVESVSGDFLNTIQASDLVSFSAPWVFGTGINSLWSVGGFSFDLLSSNVVLQSEEYLLVSGTGTIVDTGGTYADTAGTWSFSIPGDSALGIFSFAAASKSLPGSTSVPESGMTALLLLLALSTVYGVRRFV